jgi:hypothetical protein
MMNGPAPLVMPEGIECGRRPLGPDVGVFAHDQDLITASGHADSCKPQ